MMLEIDSLSRAANGRCGFSEKVIWQTVLAAAERFERCTASILDLQTLVSDAHDA